MVGDPPNIIIASYATFSFNEFLIHLFPVTVVVGVVATLFIRHTYKDWMLNCGSCFDKIADLNPADEIIDPEMMNKTLMILACVFILFVFHDHFGVTPAFVALTGAGATLLVNYYDPEKVLKHVEWSSLLFFASLFVMVGVMEVAGIFGEIAEQIKHFAGHDELRAALLILWITGLLTSFVDRISTTVAMAPVIVQLGADVVTEAGVIEPGLNIIPLWWALAMGVGFGGNSTPIGSAAGIVTVGLSSKFGYDISLKDWFKIGFPTAMFSLVMATVLIIAFWGFFS
jgi:Na+/H+ antiporter NhaD/arsenite permease-like protein